VDRLVYISQWEKAIKNVIENNPDLAERVKVGDDQEVEEFVRENVFDRPKEFFNERNLSRAYRVFAGLLDYVRAGLGTEKLPSREDQLMELVESIRTEHDLDVEQTRLLKILVKQLSQSSQLLSRFDKGDYTFLDEAPFSQFGGTRMYIARFDAKLGVVFDSVRTNPAISIVE